MKITVRGVGVTLADALREKTDIPLSCGGKGTCGACRVRAFGELSAPDDTERRILGGLISEWRLACRAVCMGKVTVELDLGEIAILTDTAESFGASLPISKSRYGIAVDIGTTTVAAKLIETSTGNVAATVSAPNPQRSHGADVMTRIEYAVSGGANTLRREMADTLCALIDGLTHECVDTAVIVGNTAMLCFLAGVDVTSMATAPFTLPSRFGRFYGGDTLLGKCKVGRVYLAPCVSAFVGADITSAMLACGFDREGGFRMLADIGTNGEMAAVRGGKITCASAPAGPAFEGAEISCGMTASEGAVDAVTFVDGKPRCHTIGGMPPMGICGGGLVSAVSEMLSEGIIDEGGYLDASYELCENVTITPSDVRMLQTAKSAIRSGLDLLSSRDIPEKLYLAGGFGSKLSPEACVRIGLLPEWATGRTEAVGNAALSGACMMLQDENMLRHAETMAKNAVTAPLDTSPEFAELFVENLLFNKGDKT